MTFEERMSKLENIFKNFRMVGQDGITTHGSLYTGYAIQTRLADAGSTAGFPTPIPGPPVDVEGACCTVAGDCSQMSEDDCIAAGGIWTDIGTPCDPDPCPSCSHTMALGCIGIICDTSGSGPTTYTSVFNLSPGYQDISAWCCDVEFTLSGSEGPSDSATLDWTVTVTPDGMGGYSAVYMGTVTGKYGDSQSFTVNLEGGDCSTLCQENYTGRECGPGGGACGDIYGCTSAKTLLAFDGGPGFGAFIQIN